VHKLVLCSAHTVCIRASSTLAGARRRSSRRARRKQAHIEPSNLKTLTTLTRHVFPLLNCLWMHGSDALCCAFHDGGEDAFVDSSGDELLLEQMQLALRNEQKAFLFLHRSLCWAIKATQPKGRRHNFSSARWRRSAPAGHKECHGDVIFYVGSYVDLWY